MDILSIRELTKSFGSRTVIDHLHLSVPAHSVFGFIGKNGAGRTMAKSKSTVNGYLLAKTRRTVILAIFRMFRNIMAL